jgi:hypothetical protein
MGEPAHGPDSRAAYGMTHNVLAKIFTFRGIDCFSLVVVAITTRPLWHVCSVAFALRLRPCPSDWSHNRAQHHSNLRAALDS